MSVSKMGAVAGMSGSPLYIDGKLAGALSYQIQRFETVRFAGFTPAADLVEVRERVTASTLPTPKSSGTSLSRSSESAPPSTLNTQLAPLGSPHAPTPLAPAFTLTGLNPAVADLFAPRFTALGLPRSRSVAARNPALPSPRSTRNPQPSTPLPPPPRSPRVPPSPSPLPPAILPSPAPVRSRASMAIASPRLVIPCCPSAKFPWRCAPPRSSPFSRHPCRR